MNITSAQNGGGLVAATKELEMIVNENGQDLEVILVSGQKCCAEIHTYFEIKPQPVPVKAVLDAILVLKRAMSCTAEKATTSEQKLSTLKHAFWHESLFPTIKSCCFNERWHSAFIQSDSHLHAAFQATIRDMFKQHLILFISGGIAAQTLQAGGLCFAAFLHFILDLASTAAELIGWRDARVETAPYLRNYGLVNVLWMAVTKFWSSIPPPLRSHLVNHKRQGKLQGDQLDLSAVSVVQQLLEYFRRDFVLICDKKLAADVNLLPFWTVQISKMLAAYPEMALTVWKEMYTMVPTARCKVETIEIEANNHSEGADAAAAAAARYKFGRAVEEAAIWGRLVRLQRQALSLLPAELLDSCIEEVRKSISKLNKSKNDSIVTGYTLSAIIELLGQMGSMPPASRIACMPLFKEAMLSIPDACFARSLATTKLRQNAADSLLVFVLSIASAATSSASEENKAGAVEGAQAVWEDCQVFLMECSMTPHPYMLNILSIIWSSLVSVSDGPATKHFLSAMHDLLCATAATEAGAAAAEGTFKPISPTNQQLTHLLGVLLASVPQQVTESFYERFLKLDNEGMMDFCQVAALSAVLRATPFSGRTVPYKIIKKLIVDMGQVIATVVSGNSTAAAQKLSNEATKQLPASILLYLPLAVDFLGASLETVQSYYLDYVEESSIEKTVNDVAKTCLTLLALPDGATALYVPADLRTLYLAWSLLPDGPHISELERLASFMERTLHASPAAAAGIAQLTPALSTLPAAPKVLFKALLGPSPSASLQFLGREAYVKYAKKCPDENVLRALPRQWLDPSGTKLSEQAQPVMEKYLARTPGPPRRPSSPIDKENYGFDLFVNKEVEKMAVEASAGLAAMKVRAMELSAKMRSEHQDDPNNTIAVVPSGEMCASGMHSAAVHVMRAVKNLQKVWMPVTKSSGDPSAAEAVMSVKQARDALTALLE